jgi:hypothetical protein
MIDALIRINERALRQMDFRLPVADRTPAAPFAKKINAVLRNLTQIVSVILLLS